MCAIESGGGLGEIPSFGPARPLLLSNKRTGPGGKRGAFGTLQAGVHVNQDRAIPVPNAHCMKCTTASSGRCFPLPAGERDS